MAYGATEGVESGIFFTVTVIPEPMRRRPLLATVGASLPLLSGCAGILGSDGGTDTEATAQSSETVRTEAGSGPAAVVRSFTAAVLAGNLDQAATYLHPEGRLDAPGDAAIEAFVASEQSLQGTASYGRADGSVRVAATVGTRTDGMLHAVDRVYELRPSSGDWRIYDQPIPWGNESAGPDVQWLTEEPREGRAVSAIVFRHTGGGEIRTEKLSVHLYDWSAAVTGGPAAMGGGDTVRLAFGADGATRVAGGMVELRWNGSETATLATVSLPWETTGPPTTPVTASD